MKYKGYEIKQQNHQLSKEEIERRIKSLKEHIDTMEANNINFLMLYSNGFTVKSISK